MRKIKYFLNKRVRLANIKYVSKARRRSKVGSADKYEINFAKSVHL